MTDAYATVCHNRTAHAPHPYHPFDGDHDALTVLCLGLRDGWTDEDAFDLFVKTKGDSDRLALGLEVLSAALAYAREAGAQSWGADIYEYVYALESGKGLNRPL